MSKRVTCDPAKNLDLYFRKRRAGSKEFIFKNSDGTNHNLTDTFEFRSGFPVDLTVLDNKITFDIDEEQSDTKNDSYFWELVNTVTKRTWLCGTSYLTQGNSAEEDEQITITIDLEGETVEVTINEAGSGEGTEHFKGTWDASGDTFPGDADTVAGDWWVFTIGGTLDGGDWPAKTISTALTDNPGQDTDNWRLH